MNTAPKILDATDFSKSSDKVLEFACGIANMKKATMVVVHVCSAPSCDEGEGMLYDGLESERLDALERRLRALRPGIESGGVEHRLLKGDPACEILKLAEVEDIGLIAMGTHGRSGLSRLLMGSVAEEVVRRATCPALMNKVPIESPSS